MHDANQNNNQLVIITRADLEALLSEQRQILNEVNKAKKSADITSYGEEIRTITCNGVRYLTRIDTAKLLNLSFPTLFRYNRDGILTSIKLGPRSVYYRYDDVVRMMGGKAKELSITDKEVDLCK